MKLFNLINNERAVPSEECYAIKAFEKIIKMDKTKEKDTATRWFSYVYHMNDWQSAYQSYTRDLRKEKLLIDLFGKVIDVPKYVEEAEDKYRELKETDSIRMLRSARAAAQKIENYFGGIDFMSDDPGKEAKDLIANISNLGKVISGIKQLEEEVKKEQAEGSVVRKGVEITEFNDGGD